MLTFALSLRNYELMAAVITPAPSLIAALLAVS
jgi:hypothetical protein